MRAFIYLRLLFTTTGIVFAPSVGAEITPVPNSVVARKNEGAQPRNVVFILSDDHRYDAMSFMGHPFAKTPHQKHHIWMRW